MPACRPGRFSWARVWGSPTALALAPNLGWRDIPLEELLAPISCLDPVVVANEADLAAFAVAHSVPGAPSGPSSFIYVSGEVGVGSGIVVDHRPLRGVRGWSGEIGHICADPNGPMCKCGARGCLESYLGMYALASRAGLDRGARAADILREAAVSERARSALDEAGAALGRCLAEGWSPNWLRHWWHRPGRSSGPGSCRRLGCRP